MPNPSLWFRVRDLVARLFRRRPPQPGRFVAGHKFSWRGWLGAAPWVWPARDYLVYVPAGYTRWKRRPLIVFIHGCRQTPEELAAGTRIAALVDRHGWLILFPRQSKKANPWRSTSAAIRVPAASSSGVCLQPWMNTISGGRFQRV